MHPAVIDCELQPKLIDKIDGAIRQSAPDKRRNRVDEVAKLLSLLRATPSARLRFVMSLLGLGLQPARSSRHAAKTRLATTT